jgi:uncharacterized membrane protein YdjX (TVP38/TMEM64 family)
MMTMKEALASSSCAREKEASTKSFAWRFAPLGVIVAALALGYALGLHGYFSLGYVGESREVLRGYVDTHYALTLVAFILAYVLATAASFPVAAVLSMVGGFLFGWLVGSLAVVFAATFGASILFLAARSACGGLLCKRVGGFGERLARGFERDPFTYLLVLRLAPFIPFCVVNVAPALFDVRLKIYVAATAIGILPGALAYTMVGQGLDSVLVAAREAGRDATLGDLVTPQITYALAGLALVAIVAAVVKTLWSRRAS